MNTNIIGVALLALTAFLVLVTMIVSTFPAFEYDYDLALYRMNDLIEIPIEGEGDQHGDTHGDNTQGGNTQGDNTQGQGGLRNLGKHYFTNGEDILDAHDDRKKVIRICEAGFSFSFLNLIDVVGMVFLIFLGTSKDGCRRVVLIMMIVCLVFLIIDMGLFAGAFKMMKDYYDSLVIVKEIAEYNNVDFVGPTRKLFNQYKKSKKMLAACIALSTISIPCIVFSFVLLYLINPPNTDQEVPTTTTTGNK